MKSILPLFLLCACSAWAGEITHVPVWDVGATNIIETPTCFVDVERKLARIQYNERHWVIVPVASFTNIIVELPGGHTNFIPATPDTAMKVMALRRSAALPPTPPGVTPNPSDLTPLFSAQGQVVQVSAPEPQRIVLDKHGFIIFNSEKPQKPSPHPNIPERTGLDVEKERVRIAAMLGEKAKAVSTGILYPYSVDGLNHFFDTPDDWTGWLIQRRGPQDDHWSDCGKSVGEPTRGSTVAGIEGYQYRLLRTAP